MMALTLHIYALLGTLSVQKQPYTVKYSMAAEMALLQPIHIFPSSCLSTSCKYKTLKACLQI